MAQDISRGLQVKCHSVVPRLRSNCRSARQFESPESILYEYPEELHCTLRV